MVRKREMERKKGRRAKVAVVLAAAPVEFRGGKGERESTRPSSSRFPRQLEDTEQTISPTAFLRVGLVPTKSTLPSAYGSPRGQPDCCCCCCCCRRRCCCCCCRCIINIIHHSLYIIQAHRPFSSSISSCLRIRIKLFYFSITNPPTSYFNKLLDFLFSKSKTQRFISD